MFLNGGAFIATIAKNRFIELGAVEYKVFLYVVGLLLGTWRVDVHAPRDHHMCEREAATQPSDLNNDPGRLAAKINM